jgi:hypothetical protein
MKGTAIAYLSVMVALVCGACEQTLDVDLPYEKKLVVDGFIIADSSDVVYTRSISLTKTIPVLDDPNTAIKDVLDGRIWIDDGDTTIELKSVVSQRLFENPRAVGTWYGRTITATAQGEGLTAVATTRIPSQPEVLSIQLVDTLTSWGSAEKALVMRIVVDGGTVNWIGSDSRGVYATPMSLYDAVYASAKQSFEKDTMVIRSRLYNLYGEDSVNVAVYSADGIYLRYLQSPYGDGSDPFGFGGVNPFFNVGGDGIGLLIGVAAVHRKVER